MKRWPDGAADRKESVRRLDEALGQFGSDMSRNWKVYRRSLLAVVGLSMVIFVSTVSMFAHIIAVEHPYRNLQDTEDLWSIDYEPRRAHPFSEECDWHEQSISLTKLRRDNVMTVVAESDDKVGSDNRYYRDTLSVIEFISLEDNVGGELDTSLISIDAANSSILVISQEMYDNMSLTTVWLTYEFDNSAMHHWWMPDGYDVCIFGTNNQGQDMFSKVLYGSRVSLKIGITVAMLTVTLGTIVGSISGYYGGRVDEVIMRICDIFFAVPGLILAMAFVTAMSAMTSLTMPVWLGVLIPIIFLWMVFKDSLKSTLILSKDSQTFNFLKRNRGFFYGIILIFFLLGISGVPLWPELFGNFESGSSRTAVSLGLIIALSGLWILDQKFIENASFDEAAPRFRAFFDWTNPWRYLSLRTIAIFIAAVILMNYSGTVGDDIVVIKDFDRLWKIQAALIFTGWPGYARLIRGQVLYVKEMTFVEAARSVGAPSGRIMFRHILPNAWAPLLVAFTLDIGGTILSASGLSFIGLGAAPGTAEWGILVSESRQFFLDDPHLMFFPGIAIAVTTLGFNLLGDGLRDVVDPKNRR